MIAPPLHGRDDFFDFNVRYDRAIAAAIHAQVEDLIRVGFDDGRGLAVSPTASPYMAGRGADCYPQYAAMVETVRGAGYRITAVNHTGRPAQDASSPVA